MTNRRVLSQDGSKELCEVRLRVGAPPAAHNTGINGQEDRCTTIFMYDEGPIYAGQELEEPLEVFGKTCGEKAGSLGEARMESFQHPV